MSNLTIHNIIGDTDLYLIDQILKGRYNENETILDAGCGAGRNMHWFLQNNLCIYGIDQNSNCINDLKADNPQLPALRLQVANVEQMPFGDNFFNHVISSAVLHFAETTEQFIKMFAEMVRVLKPNGSIFIRMTTDIGIENQVILIKDGVYYLPDTSTRFLLTRSLLEEIMFTHQLSFIEPLKSVNVSDYRSMCTLMLQKNAIEK